MRCDQNALMKLSRGAPTLLSLSGEDYLHGRIDLLQRSDRIVQ